MSSVKGKGNPKPLSSKQFSPLIPEHRSCSVVKEHRLIHERALRAALGTHWCAGWWCLEEALLKTLDYVNVGQKLHNPTLKTSWHNIRWSSLLLSQMLPAKLSCLVVFLQLLEADKMLMEDQVAVILHLLEGRRPWGREKLFGDWCESERYFMKL